MRDTYEFCCGLLDSHFGEVIFAGKEGVRFAVAAVMTHFLLSGQASRR